MDLDKGMIRKIRGLIVFTILVIVCLWNSEMVIGWFSKGLGIIFPFVVGVAVAFIINVPMSFIERKIFENKNVQKRAISKFARPISLVLTILFLVGLVGVVIFVMVPQLTATVQSLSASLQVFIPELIVYLQKVFEDNPEILVMLNSYEYNWEQIVQTAMQFLQSGAGSVLESTMSIAKTLASLVTTAFVAFVFAIYVELQKESLNIQLRKVLFAFVPKGKAEAVLEVCALTYKTFASFLAGQCLEAVILGTMFVIALTIFNIPFALLIGVLIAFTALIPVFGAFLGCAIGAVLIFIDSPMKALTFLVIFLVLQQIEGNLIYPHVVGNSVGLPAIWVLAAVSIGASLMGIVGMLVFIPITSVVYALFREVVYLKLKKNQINPVDIETKKIG